MPSHSKLDGGDEVGRGSGLPSPAFGNDNPTAASTSRAEQKLPSLLPTSSAGKKEANRAGSGAWPSVTAGLFKQQELQSPKVKQDTKAQSEEKKKKSDREREGMFSLSDSQLQARWSFVEKINGGNWGTIWTCYQRNQKSTTTKTEGLMPFSASGFPFSQKMVDSNTKLFAVKLCRKDKTPEGSQRIRGLWNEFKVILTIIEWHSGIVRFLEFVMTPSMALLFMPYYPQQMTINLPEEVCRKYFQHLLSAIFWLHQNNVTHNDIKISNIVVSLEGDSWVPVLIDFGFATVHDLSKPNAFYSDQQWGTPEYLAPERAGGSLHDERKSDLWSLGVTFFEMATGRTPFESVDEPISTEEEIERYYQRTLTGRWIGEWELPDMMEDLIAGILKPVPEERIGFADAILHPFFDPIST
ncbi:kinase-like protein, partial [Violaceomyces palustris]